MTQAFWIAVIAAGVVWFLRRARSERRRWRKVMEPQPGDTDWKQPEQ